ncbi:MAG TPA: MBL fold metallo-hydrolase [Clostridia bacterium]|nr:MBL fold metallo-hydrolase [Clostridia bacterium]
MKITILGNNGAYTGAEGACSGYLVTEKEINIVFDMGPGTLANLQKFISIDKIDALVLSHLHYDHIGDLFILNYAVEIYKSRGLFDGKMKIYCPAVPVVDFERIKGMDGVFEVIPYNDKTIVSIGDLNIKFSEMTHSITSYACAVKCPTGLFVYTGDTSYNEKIADFSMGADILLIDAGLISEDKNKNKNANHLTAEECGLIGDDVKPGLLLLTHIMPLNDHSTILAEVHVNFKNAEIAEISKVYYI